MNDESVPTAGGPETLIVTLTDRAPARIVKDVWPVVARADAHDGQVESQANRRWRLKVRQHADGRVLVYGTYDTQWQNEHDRRAGELLDAGGDVVTAIRAVAEAIDAPERLAHECIADLPAQDA
jgi:hypothetical protein